MHATLSKLPAFKNQRKRFLTDHEEKLLLAALPDRYRKVVLIAINAGLRVSEVRYLTWLDVDFKAGELTVRAALSKNRETQTVPMTATVRRVLAELKPECSEPGDNVYGNLNLDISLIAQLLTSIDSFHHQRPQDGPLDAAHLRYVDRDPMGHYPRPVRVDGRGVIVGGLTPGVIGSLHSTPQNERRHDALSGEAPLVNAVGDADAAVSTAGEK